MKRNAILAFVFILFMLFPLQGCSSTKGESELLRDLQANNAFSLPDDVNVQELSIIKRLTDGNSKTDKVYVQVDVENSDFYQSRAYIMDYTHYNEGWLLDNVEEYWENDYWTVTPKAFPDDQVVLAELIDWSNTSIQANYDWATVEYPGQAPMFFEDGKYEFALSDKKLDGTSYTCAVSITRPFGYVTSFEDIRVTMVIDPYNYSWELISAESMALSADWYIARDWSSNDVNFYFSNVQLAEDSLILADPVAYGECMYDTALQLTIPSFECIMPATATMEYSGFRGTIYGEIILWPDKMWVVDSDGELAEFIGTIESCSAGIKTTEKYAAFATEWLESIFVYHDWDHFISLVHPILQSEFSDMDTPDWDTAPTLEIIGPSNLSLYFVKGRFETEYSNAIIGYLLEENYNVENVSAIGVLTSYYSLDGEQDLMECLIIEDNGKLYAFGG